MNGDFWNHLLNAAGHVLQAQQMNDARRQAERDARRAARAQQPDAGEPAFSAPPTAPQQPDAACCVARRKFKVR